MTEPPRKRKARPAKAGVSDDLEALVASVRRQEKLLEEVAGRLAAIEANLGRRRSLRAHLAWQTAALEALLRAAYVDRESLPYPERLTAARFGLQSQNGEDGIVLALLGEKGGAGGRFVELGCGTNGGNSGWLAYELGWSGLMVDASEDCVRACRLVTPGDRVQVVQSWVTREDVDALLAEHGLTGEIDLLSIDIDGNDYWVWEAISTVSPRLVVVEYNAFFGAERAVTVPYEPAFDRRKHAKTYFGASLRALDGLAARKGFRLVAVEPRGANAFFLRNDVRPEIPAIECARAFRRNVAPELLYELRDDANDPNALPTEDTVFDELERAGLTLEELE